MASLASVTPGSSYPGLIKTIGNDALTTCTQLSDGDGNALPISISAQKNSVNLGSTSNLASGCFSTILGGTGNCALGMYSIAGGINNCAVGDRTIALGFCNTALESGAISLGACNGVRSAVGIPYSLSTISGGYNNFICGHLSFVGGGIINRICGGSCNAIVGGEQNTILACFGGCSVSSNFIGAGRYNAITSSVTNCVNSIHSVIAGGCSNIICGAQFGTIPGGAFNRVDNAASVTVGGGIVAGGAFNTVSSEDGSILAGRSNTVTGSRGSIINGTSNNVSGCCSGIFNGCCNVISSDFSSVLGGSNNNSCLPYSGIFGCAITSSMACAFHANRIVVTQLPSSASGLPSGALWYDPADSNRVKYVP